MTKEETGSLIEKVENFAQLSMELIDIINDSDASQSDKVRLMVATRLLFDAGMELIKPIDNG